MFDAWMKLGATAPNTFADPWAAALAMPVAASTTAATWAGVWSSLPLASLSAFGVLTGSPQPQPVKAVAAKRAPRPAAKPKVSAKTTSRPKVDDRPAGLDAPRAGKPDDLKRISGIGPKLESVLHDLGIYHFDQIASWSKKEINWVDDYLRFKGRIERDGWIAQAKTFAKEVA